MNCNPEELLKWVHANLATEGDCLVWTRSISSNGYGCFCWRGKTHTVPRFVLEHATGPLGDLQALHTCDNRRCCKLEHLFRGTAMANTHDMMRKGRQKLTSEFLNMQRAGVPKRRCI
jgi:hypothetical protein